MDFSTTKFHQLSPDANKFRAPWWEFAWWDDDEIKDFFVSFCLHRKTRTVEATFLHHQTTPIKAAAQEIKEAAVVVVLEGVIQQHSHYNNNSVASVLSYVAATVPISTTATTTSLTKWVDSQRQREILNSHHI